MQGKAEDMAQAYEKALGEARKNAQGIAQTAREAGAKASDAQRHATEAELAAKMAQAEATIAKTKTKAMGNVRDLGSDIAAIVTKLTGQAPSASEASAAVDQAPDARLRVQMDTLGRVALVIFLAILVKFGVPGAIAKALDARGEKVAQELAEARRLRQEAGEAARGVRCQAQGAAEAEAAEIAPSANDEASASRAEAEAKLADFVARRTKAAEEKIARAESQAEAEVRAAARGRCHQGRRDHPARPDGRQGRRRRLHGRADRGQGQAQLELEPIARYDDAAPARTRRFSLPCKPVPHRGLVDQNRSIPGPSRTQRARRPGILRRAPEPFDGSRVKPGMTAWFRELFRKPDRVPATEFWDDRSPRPPARRCSPPFVAATAAANAFEKVSFPHAICLISWGWLARPAGTGPFPVVIGLQWLRRALQRSGEINARESDWSQRLTSAGFAVLLVDSFGPRGIKALCNDRERR